MGTLRELKKTMMQDEKLSPLLLRSTRREVLIDLDGDKVGDIALIDDNHDGDIDTIAVDATGNGEFNLYVGDVDVNGIPDSISFYEDDEKMPIAAYFGRAVEARFSTLAGYVYDRFAGGQLDASEFVAALREFERRAKGEFAKTQSEVAAVEHAPEILDAEIELEEPNAPAPAEAEPQA